VRRHYTTQYGYYTSADGENEQDSLRYLWSDCCERATEKTDLTWTIHNTAILFYRLVEDVD
jgi:hypothetical protein